MTILLIILFILNALLSLSLIGYFLYTHNDRKKAQRLFELDRQEILSKLYVLSERISLDMYSLTRRLAAIEVKIRQYFGEKIR
jgi:hypothetical protein